MRVAVRVNGCVCTYVVYMCMWRYHLIPISNTQKAADPYNTMAAYKKDRKGKNSPKAAATAQEKVPQIRLFHKHNNCLFACNNLKEIDTFIYMRGFVFSFF